MGQTQDKSHSFVDETRQKTSQSINLLRSLRKRACCSETGMAHPDPANSCTLRQPLFHLQGSRWFTEPGFPRTQVAQLPSGILPELFSQMEVFLCTQRTSGASSGSLGLDLKGRMPTRPSTYQEMEGIMRGPTAVGSACKRNTGSGAVPGLVGI